MPSINEIQNHQGFTQDFLMRYLAGGFGGMQKRDLDTLVFGLLLKYGAFGGSVNAPDVTEISFQLGISPARVRNHPARLYHFDMIALLSGFDKNDGRTGRIFADRIEISSTKRRCRRSKQRRRTGKKINDWIKKRKKQEQK